MNNRSGNRPAGWILVIALAASVQTWASTPSDKDKTDALLLSMQDEMQRAQTSLGKLDPAPYFLSYSVYDQTSSLAVGSQGSLMSSMHGRHRSADVSMRIGTPALDNAHAQNRASAKSSGSLPLENDRNAIARELWRLTYQEYRKASKAYLNVKTDTQVHAKEEDTSPDFSQEKPPTYVEYKEVAPAPDQRLLEKLVRN
jgi:TldD protein